MAEHAHFDITVMIRLAAVVCVPFLLPRRAVGRFEAVLLLVVYIATSLSTSRSAFDTDAPSAQGSPRTWRSPGARADRGGDCTLILYFLDEALRATIGTPGAVDAQGLLTTSNWSDSRSVPSP